MFLLAHTFLQLNLRKMVPVDKINGFKEPLCKIPTQFEVSLEQIRAQKCYGSDSQLSSVQFKSGICYLLVACESCSSCSRTVLWSLVFIRWRKLCAHIIRAVHVPYCKKTIETYQSLAPPRSTNEYLETCLQSVDRTYSPLPPNWTQLQTPVKTLPSLILRRWSVNIWHLSTID